MAAAKHAANTRNLCSSGMSTHGAPDPYNINWNGINVNNKSRFIRTILVNIFIFFLIFFWTIPVTFVASLSNLNTLSQVPGLNFLVSFIQISPVVTGFVEGFLPTLALVIFYAVLVPIIKAVVNLQGLQTQSQIDKSVMSKYFMFLLFNVFFVYAIAGTIFVQLENLIHNPGSIPTLLANSLPQQSFFFINYIMILSISGQMKQLFRPTVLAMYWLKKKYLAKTPRAIRKVENPGRYMFQTYTATHVLIFLIAITYSTLAPFILIFAAIYFGLAYLTARYNLLYVYMPSYEAGGFLFPFLFKRVMSALIIYQLVLVGEFGVLRFVPGAVISGVMAIATFVFWIILRKRFGSASGEILSGFANPRFRGKHHDKTNSSNNNNNSNNSSNSAAADPAAPIVPVEAPANYHAVDVPQSFFFVNPIAYQQPSLKEPQPLSELPGDIEATRGKMATAQPYGSGSM